MKLRKLLSLSIAAILLCFTGCVNKNTLSKHEPITILAPYLECDRLVDLVDVYKRQLMSSPEFQGSGVAKFIQKL